MKDWEAFNRAGMDGAELWGSHSAAEARKK